jgi:selenocysteine-specific elongation factor
LRRPSPGETLGGGVLIDHQPKGRHKRFDQEVLRSLESLSKGTPAEILYEAALALQVAPMREIVTRSRLETSNAEPALQELLLSHLIIPLEAGEPDIQSDLLVVTLPHWNSLRDSVMQTMETYHASYPLRRGIPREEMKSRLKLSPRVFNATINKLVSQGLVTDRAPFLAKPGHEISFDAAQQIKIQNLERRFEGSPMNPPSLKERQVTDRTDPRAGWSYFV